ncbi:MAG: Mrp/NBP35 family ATP-binding protein [Pseudomonadota bacterium]
MFQSKDAQIAAITAAVEAALDGENWLETAQINQNRTATLILRADPDDLGASERRRKLAMEAALSVPGIEDVNALLTAERAGVSASTGKNAAENEPIRVTRGAKLSDRAMRDNDPKAKLEIPAIPGIRCIIAVASAKGGVGKSTVAVNLAAALAKLGYSVGVLDADVYGPSIPTMLGVEDADPKMRDDGKLDPIAAHGFKSLSIGYLTEADAPMIWRGPMVMSAMTQMLNDAAWGNEEAPLDLLIIDTPPGTGDAALTLAQRVPLDGAVIVTTPQTVALADVRRGVAMFAKTAVPVIGIIETMSWFEDPSGKRHELFGKGGGRAMAEHFGLPLLAEIPILMEIREGGDLGAPAALGDGAAAQTFEDIARSVVTSLEDLEHKPPPAIVFED